MPVSSEFACSKWEGFYFFLKRYKYGMSLCMVRSIETHGQKIVWTATAEHEKNVPVVPPFFSFRLAPAIQQDFQDWCSVTDEKSI